MAAFSKPPVDMPKQTPEERKTNFNEVAHGYTPEMAKEEAERCLQCKNPQCVKGCPVNIDIPAFIKLITEEKYVEAANEISQALDAKDLGNDVLNGIAYDQENKRMFVTGKFWPKLFELELVKK